MWLILVMKTSESCMYSLELCFQICNSIEHYISLVRKTFRQFYNPFQIQEFYKAMSFLHVFSASLEKKKRNESWAVLVSRSAVCYAAQSGSFELVCKILKCTIQWNRLRNAFLWIYWVVREGFNFDFFSKIIGYRSNNSKNKWREILSYIHIIIWTSGNNCKIIVTIAQMLIFRWRFLRRGRRLC